MNLTKAIAIEWNAEGKKIKSQDHKKSSCNKYQLQDIVQMFLLTLWAVLCALQVRDTYLLTMGAKISHLV